MMAVASGHSRDFGVCGGNFGVFADRSSNAGYAYLRLWGGMGGISAATCSHGTVQTGVYIRSTCYRIHGTSYSYIIYAAIDRQCQPWDVFLVPPTAVIVRHHPYIMRPISNGMPNIFGAQLYRHDPRALRHHHWPTKTSPIGKSKRFSE